MGLTFYSMSKITYSLCISPISTGGNHEDLYTFEELIDSESNQVPNPSTWQLELAYKTQHFIIVLKLYP